MDLILSRSRTQWIQNLVDSELMDSEFIDPRSKWIMNLVDPEVSGSKVLSGSRTCGSLSDFVKLWGLCKIWMSSSFSRFILNLQLLLDPPPPPVSRRLEELRF